MNRRAEQERDRSTAEPDALRSRGASHTGGSVENAHALADEAERLSESRSLTQA